MARWKYCIVCELDGLRTDEGNFHNMFLALNVVTKHQANTVKIGFHFALFSIMLEIITCEAFLFGLPCLILHLVGRSLKYVAISS